MTISELFNSWRNARDGMELGAELGDRRMWAEARAEAQALEDEIFSITGKRPPYSAGWGAAFENLKSE